jgi:hypothetical protein
MVKFRRWLLILGCLAAVVLAGYLTLRLTAPVHRFKTELINSIKWGMTENEVDAILGTKAEVFPWKRTTYPLDLKAGEDDEFISKCREWLGEKTSVLVYFESGRVQWYLEGDILDDQESFLDKLRRWLGM